MQNTPNSELLRTPFYESHKSLGARLTGFGGWDMPLQYKGIIQEAQHCRSKVSVFDTCHMGEFLIQGKDALEAINPLVTADVFSIPPGRCKYSLLLNDEGGIIDDLILYRLDESSVFVVVNAGTRQEDYTTFSNQIETYLKSSGSSDSVGIQDLSDNLAKIDIQGPKARKVLLKLLDSEGATASLCESVTSLKFFSFCRETIPGEWGEPSEILISRTGYTGELGFEIYAPSAYGVYLWNRLLQMKHVEPAGLGARDILRLEAGLPLSGSDMGPETTPVEAGLLNFVNMKKTFRGKSFLEEQLQNHTGKRRVAFRVNGRRTPRHGYELLHPENKKVLGEVSSGVFSPALECGIGMGSVDLSALPPGSDNVLQTGSILLAHQGRAEFEVEICELPFFKEGSLRD